MEREAAFDRTWPLAEGGEKVLTGCFSQEVKKR